MSDLDILKELEGEIGNLRELDLSGTRLDESHIPEELRALELKGLKIEWGT